MTVVKTMTNEERLAWLEEQQARRKEEEQLREQEEKKTMTNLDPKTRALLAKYCSSEPEKPKKRFEPAPEELARAALKQEMQQLLAPEDLQWVKDEHFRLLCGSGIDRDYLSLGFRAMLRRLDDEVPVDGENSKSKEQTQTLKVGYMKFIKKHLSELNRQCLKTSDRLLRSEIRAKRWSLQGIQQKVCPVPLAYLIFDE